MLVYTDDEECIIRKIRACIENKENFVLTLDCDEDCTDFIMSSEISVDIVNNLINQESK